VNWFGLLPSGFGYNVSTVQLLITIAIATFDVIVVWFGVWIPMRRSVARGDRPFIWRGLAEYAAAARKGHEAELARAKREEERMQRIRGSP
jgi:hypothetical protein